MPGRFAERQLDAPDIKSVAVCNLKRFKLRIRAVAVNDLRTGFLRQLDMPAHKIGMRMRFDDVFDLLAVRLSFVQILLHVALRVDDRPLAL